MPRILSENALAREKATYKATPWRRRQGSLGRASIVESEAKQSGEEDAYDTQVQDDRC